MATTTINIQGLGDRKVVIPMFDIAGYAGPVDTKTQKRRKYYLIGCTIQDSFWTNDGVVQNVYSTVYAISSWQVEDMSSTDKNNLLWYTIDHNLLQGWMAAFSQA